jgi:1-acyl-sn-glycerol-3-phosphate acyltransferase
MSPSSGSPPPQTSPLQAPAPPQPSRAPQPPHPPDVAPLALADLGRAAGPLLGRHFGAVRLSRTQRPNLTAARQRSLLVYFNHASWWDPLVCAHLASHLLPERRHFAIVEAATLDGEPLFAQLGFVGLEPESPRGSRSLLEVAAQVLDQPDAALWIAAGGSLADPRERPPKLQPGLGHLAARLRHCVLLPLALEYPFWSGRLPEALARLGEEVALEDLGMRALDWLEVLADRLAAAQDELAAESCLRDSGRFEPVLGGGGEKDDGGDLADRPRGAWGGSGAGGYRGLLPAWRRLRDLLSPRRRPRGPDAGPGEMG